MQLVNKSAIRICKSLEHALYAKARLGESRHEAKAAARDEYLTMHGTLAGYNPAKAPGIYSVGTLARLFTGDVCVRAVLRGAWS